MAKLFKAPCVLNALDGGDGASVDCDWMAPDDYLRHEFEPRSRSETRRAFDERAFHIARLVSDVDERDASLSDALRFARIVQCALRVTDPAAAPRSLDALIATCDKGGFHVHFDDVLLATQPADRETRWPLTALNLLRWCRRNFNVVFKRLPDDLAALRSQEPPAMRIDVDPQTLRDGVRLRVHGTARPRRPVDSIYRVVAVLSDDYYTVHKPPRHNVDPLWYCRAVPRLSLSSLSVRPNAAQVARFMADPHASLLRMTCGSPYVDYHHVPRCDLATQLTPVDLVEVFFTMDVRVADEIVASDAVRLTYVDPHMAVAELRRAHGDSVECPSCLSRVADGGGGGGAACTTMYSFVRWHRSGEKAVVGDRWHSCSAFPGVVVSATSPRTRVNLDEWEVIQPVERVPEVAPPLARPPPPAHFMSMPIGYAVHENGFSLGGGARTHDWRDMAQRYGFIPLAREFLRMQGYKEAAIEQLTSAFCELPMVERVVRYVPSLDDPEQAKKPKLYHTVKRRLRAVIGSDGKLRLVLIRATIGAGKTKLMKKLVARAVRERGGRGPPLFILAVTATRTVSAKLNEDLGEAIAGVRHIVSFYDDDRREAVQSGVLEWSDELGNSNVDVVVRVSSLNNSLLRSAGLRMAAPDFLLIDESEQAIDYATVSPTLGTEMKRYGVLPPSHVEACEALIGVGARTKRAVLFCDHDASISSRCFAALMAIDCAQTAHRNEVPCRAIEYVEWRLDIRVPQRFVELPSGNYKLLCALVNHFVFEQRKRVFVADTTVRGVERIGREARSANATLREIDDALPDESLVMLHGELKDDGALLKALARNPDLFVRANQVFLLVYTAVLGRGSSFDTTRPDTVVVASHPHMEHRENIVQSPGRARLTSEQLATGVRTTYIHFDRDMDKSYAEKARLLATVPLGVALAACEENLLRRHDERDYTVTKELRRLARRLLDNRSAATVQRGPNNRGRPFLQANCPLTLLALLHTARRFVGCLLHYAVYMQEIHDNDYERTSLQAYDPALFAAIKESAVDVAAVERSLIYEQLCTAADAKPDERSNRLRALGVLAPDGDVSLAVRERLELSLPSCVPDRRLAQKSPTFVYSMMSGDVDLELLRIYAFLTHQGDAMDDEQLPVRLGATIRAAIAKPQGLRAPDALAKRRESSVTLVLLALGCLRTFRIERVHDFPRRRGKSQQYQHKFCVDRFDGDARVRDPWPPYAELSGDEFTARVLASVPRLKRDYGLCRGVRTDDDRTKYARAVFASIVNSVLGCAIIAGDAVRSDYLWYKAALVPAWAQPREHVVIKPELLEWFDRLGDVWAPAFQYEADNGGRPLRPFAHPAHARHVQTRLSVKDFRPPGELSDAEIRKRDREAAAAVSELAIDVDEGDQVGRIVQEQDQVRSRRRVYAADFVDSGVAVSPDESNDDDDDDDDSSDEFDNDEAKRKERVEELEYDEEDE